jgi:predicted enzyme related to lactoylglutathione lyase
MNKVVHFELPADNVERAKKFYKEAFDWQIEDVPEMDYTILRTVEVDENRMPKESGVINGGMLKRDSEKNVVTNPTFAVDVEDIDEAVKKIKNAGGLLVKEKMPVGNMGFIAYFKDTEGNILSIWQTK